MKRQVNRVRGRGIQKETEGEREKESEEEGKGEGSKGCVQIENAQKTEEHTLTR